MKPIVGRDEEISILEEIFRSDSAEFVALFGRRRVGKTYLVRNTFKGRKNTIFFNVTGMLGGKAPQQIKNFFEQLVGAFYRPGMRLDAPKNWYDALKLLASEIEASPSKRIVLFFDEFPWMVTRKSELLIAFAYFWNQLVSDDPRVKLIICGSSASWILKKIVNDRGALYNRVTQKIHLQPFNLYETKKYLAFKKINLDNNQIAQLYMVLGGIPFYLDQAKRGLSTVQIIANLAFKEHSFLIDEFENLYATLFNGGEGHIQLARVIANHRYGIGQEELFKAAKLKSGGTVIRWLRDLEKAGFIERYKPFSKKKSILYKMVDEYSYFYFKWIEPIKDPLQLKALSKEYWESEQDSQEWRIWAGYAFESLCYKHLHQLRKALGINVKAKPYTWRYAPPVGSLESGAQIDLLFDRRDGMITVCEIKYTQKPFVIDKAYAVKLKNKIKVFEERTKTKKQFVLTIISANGLKKNMYSEEMVSGVCTLENLFKKVD